MISLNISRCSGSADTCPVKNQAIVDKGFYETVGSEEPDAADICEGLGMFATWCANGICPGQNLDQTKDVLRQIIDKPTDDL